MLPRVDILLSYPGDEQHSRSAYLVGLAVEAPLPLV